MHEQLVEEMALSCRVFLIVLGTTAAVCGLLSLFVRPVHHDLDQARSVVREFITRACVERRSERAYTLVSNRMKQYVEIDKFHDAITNLHPDGFPSAVMVSEYEPVLGKRALNVFATGVIGDRRLYYRVLIVGDATEGYKIESFARGNGPYPLSTTRQPFP